MLTQLGTNANIVVGLSVLSKLFYDLNVTKPSTLPTLYHLLQNKH